jgi:hypothetical protein
MLEKYTSELVILLQRFFVQYPGEGEEEGITCTAQTLFKPTTCCAKL